MSFYSDYLICIPFKFVPYLAKTGFHFFRPVFWVTMTLKYEYVNLHKDRYTSMSGGMVHGQENVNVLGLPMGTNDGHKTGFVEF